MTDELKSCLKFCKTSPTMWTIPRSGMDRTVLKDDDFDGAVYDTPNEASAETDSEGLILKSKDVRQTNLAICLTTRQRVSNSGDEDFVT